MFTVQKMEEPKLSLKEQALLEPFYEMDLYLNALIPVMTRWGNGIAKYSAEQAQDMNVVMYNRGKLDMIKQFHKFVKHINENGRKSSSVKSK